MPDLSVLLLAEPTLVVAYVVFGMVGFGTTLVSAPILAHVLPLSTVVPALALTDFVASWANGFRLGAHVSRKELLALLPAMALGLYIGHRVNLKLDRQRFLRVLYGVLLLTGTSLVWRAA